MTFSFAKFSTKAKEFVPGFSLSSKAPEFTPTGATLAPTFQFDPNSNAPEFTPSGVTSAPQFQFNMNSAVYVPCAPQQSTQAPVTCLFNLDDYSDDSSNDSSDSDDDHDDVQSDMAISPSNKPSTPTPSTCAPRSESSCLDSDASDKEQESAEASDKEQESDHEDVHAEVQSISDLMKMRHAVDPADGIEDRLGAEEVTLPPSEEHSGDEKPRRTPKASDRPPARNRGDGAKRGTKGKGRKPTSTKIHQKAADSSWPGPDQSTIIKEELIVSEESWLSQQVARRRASEVESLSDGDIVRAIKSNLNKLTIEKFEPIYQKLVSCGVSTSSHVETLIHEVFEKATTQHHFVDMYADLCERLHAHFVENPVSDNPKTSFKKILLNGCQSFFEKHLTPPAGLEKLDEEERVAMERKFKMQMIGNIKFVGALLVRQMLAAKVLFAICEELLRDPHSESLESLAVLLTVVGPKFDTPEWTAHVMLVDIFKRVQALAKDPTISRRVVCLLKDVLELRGARWRDRKPKKIDGPTSLKAVADTQAKEEGSSGNVRKSVSGPKQGYQGKPSPSHGYQGKTAPSSPGGAGGKKVTSLAGLFGNSPKPAAPAEGYQRINSLAGLKGGVKSSKDFREAEKAGQSPKQAAPFDKEAFRKLASAVIAELRLSHEVEEAISRTSAFSVPASHQAEELCNMLGIMVEEGAAEARQACFKLVAGLFAGGFWKSATLRKGLQNFLELCPDLACDVPTLPKILREELHPVLASLVTTGHLQQSQLDTLLESQP